MKKKLQALFQENYFRVVFSLFILGTFLRFYRLSVYVTFLGDQGRDAIVLRRILTFEHLPAIGAPTSVGQVYLGPFYYYFIAPWLAIFNFHPIGPAVGVAFFSSIFILVCYFVAKELIDKKTALIFTALIAISPSLIDLGRYSWNPNLLPVFTLLFFYFFTKATKTSSWKYFVLSGAFLSFCIQLHYIALVLGLPIVLVILTLFIKGKSSLPKNLKNLIAMSISFAFFSLPLLVFDLRHNFLNTRNLIKLFTDSSAVGGGKIQEILTTFQSLNLFSFGVSFPFIVSNILLIVILIVSAMMVRKQKESLYLFIFALLSLVGVSLYSGPKYIHYFTIVYPFYYFVLAIFLSKIVVKKMAWAIIVAVFIVYGYFSVSTMRFFFDSPSNQIDHAKAIATLIKSNTIVKNYQVTGLPDQYSDSTYRYFLEIWGRRPIAKDSLERAKELFVVCEKGCKIIGDPQWDIAYFAPNKIVGEWTIGNDRIYKLTR